MCQVLLTWFIVYFNQVLQVQVTIRIFCKPSYFYEIKKRWVPMFYRYKTSLFSCCICRSSSQEVVEFVGDNIISSFKAQCCKWTIDIYIIGWLKHWHLIEKNWHVNVSTTTIQKYWKHIGMIYDGILTWCIIDTSPVISFLKYWACKCVLVAHRLFSCQLQQG